MTANSGSISDRIQEYWMWVSVVLFLLITVDVITTLYAAHLYGSMAEANPLMQWVLEQEFPVLVATNLLAGALAIGIFYGIIRNIEEAPDRFQWVMSKAFEVWVGLLLSVGVAVLTNNLLVIFFQQSLL